MTQLIKKGMLSILFVFFAMITFSQEKGLDVDIDINKKESQWYQQPWVWVLGAAIFVLLLVAILRGGGKKEA